METNSLNIIILGLLIGVSLKLFYNWTSGKSRVKRLKVALPAQRQSSPYSLTKEQIMENIKQSQAQRDPRPLTNGIEILLRKSKSYDLAALKAYTPNSYILVETKA